MADESRTAGWTLPGRPSAALTDTQFTSTLPGHNLPYGSLGAQLLDAFMQSRTLPGAPGGAYVNRRYNFSNGAANYPGGGYPPPGGPPNPGGGQPPPPGPGTTPGSPPPGTPPPGGGTPGSPGVPNDGFGPYGPGTTGVDNNWRSAVTGLLGGSDPVKAIAGLGTQGQGLNTLWNNLTKAGINRYTGGEIMNAFGSSGDGALQSARHLGIGDQYENGGQFGLRDTGLMANQQADWFAKNAPNSPFAAKTQQFAKTGGFKSQTVNGKNIIYSLDGSYTNTPGYAFVNGKLTGPGL